MSPHITFGLGWLMVATAIVQSNSQANIETLKYFDPIALGLHPSLRAIRVYIYTATDSQHLVQLSECNGHGASSIGAAMESLVIDKLTNSAFRTHDPFEADFFIVPARPACLMEAGAERQSLNEWYKDVVGSLPFFQISGGRNHIFIFTSTLGPLAFPDWYHFIHQSIFIMLQAQFDSLSTPANTADLRQYPFQHYKDIIIPIQVSRPRTSSLLDTSRVPDRRFLLFVPREHGPSSLTSLAGQHTQDILVGNPFTTDLTAAQYCVVPRTGFGWTEAAYHAALGGCIPVLLTDTLAELPFAYAIDWSKVSIKWPPDKADSRLLEYLRSIPNKALQDAQAYLENVRCSLQWEQPETKCSPMAGILGLLLRKRRVFVHSPTTFWTLGSRPLNRSLAPLESWRPPFVVEDVFLPMPKTCHGCREDAPPGTTTSCWQSGSYMHCKLVTDKDANRTERPSPVSGAAASRAWTLLSAPEAATSSQKHAVGAGHDGHATQPSVKAPLRPGLHQIVPHLADLSSGHRSRRPLLMHDRYGPIYLSHRASQASQHQTSPRSKSLGELPSAEAPTRGTAASSSKSTDLNIGGSRWVPQHGGPLQQGVRAREEFTGLGHLPHVSLELLFMPLNATAHKACLSAWSEPRMRGDSSKIFGDAVSPVGANDLFLLPF